MTALEAIGITVGSTFAPVKESIILLTVDTGTTTARLFNLPSAGTVIRFVTAAVDNIWGLRSVLKLGAIFNKEFWLFEAMAFTIAGCCW